MQKVMKDLDSPITSELDLIEQLNVYEKLREYKEVLEGINLYEGYVSDYTPFNYPVIGHYLKHLIKIENWESLTSYQKANAYR